jgi:aminopeptidase N
MQHKKLLLLFTLLIASLQNFAQYSHADTLRGTNGMGRRWWNITKYDIVVEPNIAEQTISGTVTITFNLPADYNGQPMQIDLQEPMHIDKIRLKGFSEREQSDITMQREGNVYWINGLRNLNYIGNQIELQFSGKPIIAKNAPWDGGLIWKTDENDYAWVSVACQQKGASVWYPCKDIQSDEPDSGASMTIICPEALQGIGNGRLVNSKIEKGKRYNTWAVKNPINNYNLVFYIGKYLPIKKTYDGKNGKLDCTFWAIEGNEKKADAAYDDIFKMLQAFEKWFGAYPWYTDGYQLVESPHLGMEHQSAIAYGNKYKKGYLGRDLSGTGWGKKWDYIIVHESGHEWWGNHISTNDIADMWVHEGFTTFSEALFVEEQFGKSAGEDYTIGMRSNIMNNDPMIADYGVNKEPPGDIYYKGANLLLMIRTIINNDDKFKAMLIQMQKTFGNRTCNSIEIETFICQYAGINFMPLFQQYLYTNQIPVLHTTIKSEESVTLQITNCNDNFEIIYHVPISDTEFKTITLKANQAQEVNIKLKKSRWEQLQKKGYYLF